MFELHPLLLEDILNTGQRPKLEEFENNIFITVKMLRLDTNKNEVTTEQFSMVLGHGYLLTFQEQAGDLFDPIRERLRTKKGRVRKSGVDYFISCSAENAGREGNYC